MVPKPGRDVALFYHLLNRKFYKKSIHSVLNCRLCHDCTFFYLNQIASLGNRITKWLPYSVRNLLWQSFVSGLFHFSSRKSPHAVCSLDTLSTDIMRLAKYDVMWTSTTSSVVFFCCRIWWLYKSRSRFAFYRYCSTYTCLCVYILDTWKCFML